MVSRLSQLLNPVLLVFLIGYSANIFPQERNQYPPFTIRTQMTAYGPDDEVLISKISTIYHSANGDWRLVSIVGDYESALVYRRGRGVYFSNNRTRMLIKQTNRAPGCPLRTAEQL